MMEIPRLDELLQLYASRRMELDRQGVYFLRDINDEEAERFSKAVLLMAAARQGMAEPPIRIYVNSGGGSVAAGFAMMEMMYKAKRDYGVSFQTIITGYAYSMGAIVFQAGDRRTMGYFSTMMLHSLQWVISGEDRTIFKDYEKLSIHYQRLIGELYANRTKKHNTRWWRNYIYSGHEHFLSAHECLKLGLVDEVCRLDSCYMNLPEGR
ncbi:MAG: ATP-dependent Clp protease proteolytic subunit [Chloroflexi bacterium]|nr:ATP-dependent Clp protease proteolytic subunit [Chloroflexota bacterium]